MSVYEQLKSWQKLPYAGREWKIYRGQLTAFLLKYTKSGTTAAILGAGECNDLDLSILCGHFGKVILIDNEEAPLQKACRNYHVPIEKIEFQIHDFIGISSMEYEDYSQTLQLGIMLRGSNTDIGELAELAQRKLDELYQKAFEKPLMLADRMCDYVVAAGVHSQINNMASFIWNAYERALKQYAPQMYPYFAEKNDLAVRRFDEAVLSLAKRGIIYACEHKRLGVEGSIQGAVQGIADLTRFVQEGKLRETAREHLLWNFDLAQAIAYDMLVVACEVEGVL